MAIFKKRSKKMQKKELSSLPRLLIDDSVEHNGENYAITIVSSGIVHSKPDPVLGRRYFFGNPDLAQRRAKRPKKARAHVISSDVVIVNE